MEILRFFRPHRHTTEAPDTWRLERCSWCCLALAGALITCWPAPASAQSGPYEDHVVGEHALGLAGAFVAVGDDPSALFHNPAGIATLRTVAVSGSFWARSLRSRDIEDGLTTPYGSSDLSHSAIPSLPTFVGAVLKVGRREEDGFRPHAIGIAYVNPFDDEYVYDATLRNQSGDNARQLHLIHDDGAFWIGLGYAYRPTQRLYFGASAFFARRSLDHDEFEFNATELGVRGRSAQLSVKNMRLVGRLGVLYAPSMQWQFGAMLQPPAIVLGDSAETTTLLPLDEGFSLQVNTAPNTRYELPWEVRTGATYRPGASAMFTLDVAILGAGRSSGLASRQDAPDFLFVPVSGPGKLGVRTAFGFEWVVSERFPLRGGLLLATPLTGALPPTSDRYLNDRAASFGGALSIGYRTQRLDLSIGATAVLRDGRTLGLIRAADFEPPSYRRTQMTDRAIFIYLAGGSRAVRVAAEQVKPFFAD